MSANAWSGTMSGDPPSWPSWPCWTRRASPGARSPATVRWDLRTPRHPRPPSLLDLPVQRPCAFRRNPAPAGAPRPEATSGALRRGLDALVGSRVLSSASHRALHQGRRW